MNEFATGSVEGTGAAINVSLGFKPTYVKCYNIDDAGALAPTVEWFEGMTAGHGLKGLGIADDGTTSAVSQAAITSNGISQYAGTDSVGEGFTIGADADLNAAAETIVYIAVRDIKNGS